MTRPRFGTENIASTNEIPDNLKIIGNPDIGFEVRVTFEYKYGQQDFSCDAMHRFNHQIKPVLPVPGTSPSLPTELNVKVTVLESGAGIDFLTQPNRLRTSCDTDGSGYDDIKMTVDFTSIAESKQASTVILCQMNSYCESSGDGSYSSCSEEKGLWQRCHQIKPKPSSDQSWTFKSKLISNLVLELTFENLKPDRRYDLNVGEFSLAGNLISRNELFKGEDPTDFVFYLDDTRPTIGRRRMKYHAVGTPTDGEKGRHYDDSKRPTKWELPPYGTKKWLQCEKRNVHFQAEIKDQFEHNLMDCGVKGVREDGNGHTGIIISNACISPEYWSTHPITKQPICVGPPDTGSIAGKRCDRVVKKQNIKHGRNTITFTPKDTCGDGTPDNLAWDTDLPDTFEAQNFPQSTYWFNKSQKPNYTIETVVPAKTPAGKFPKHYTVDCDENYINNNTRDDGDGGELECKLATSLSYQDDGCNPALMKVKYYHVCGGTGQSKQTNWAVHAPKGESCKNVPCDPSHLLCCPISNILWKQLSQMFSQIEITYPPMF